MYYQTINKITNAQKHKKQETLLAYTQKNQELAKLLKKEGIISCYTIQKNNINLKLGQTLTYLDTPIIQYNNKYKVNRQKNKIIINTSTKRLVIYKNTSKKKQIKHIATMKI